MRWMAVAFACALLLSGCTREPERVTLDPPTGGGFAVCPPAASRGFAVPFRADAGSVAGHPPGIHRLDPQTFLWVWLDETPTLREDRVTRVNAVDVARDDAGTVYVCTRVELIVPLDVDAEERALPVSVRLSAGSPLPAGPIEVVVNWAAGCHPCAPPPTGNMTARFD